MAQARDTKAPPELPPTGEIANRIASVYTDAYERADVVARVSNFATASVIVRYDGPGASDHSEPEDLIAILKDAKHQKSAQLLRDLGNPLSVKPVIKTMRLSKAARVAYRKALANDRADRIRYRPADDKEPLPPDGGFPYLDGMLHQFIEIEFASDADAKAALAQLKGNKNVAVAYLAAKFQFSAPSDPLYSFNFGDAGLSGQWGPKLARMESLWSLTPGHGYIAILDSGTNSGKFLASNPTTPNIATTPHPDLERSFRQHRSWNHYAASVGATARLQEVDEWYGLVNSQYVNQDVIGHGTHVHGIIAATHNTQGIAGQCQSCSVQVGMIANVKSSVPNNNFSESTVADAIRKHSLSGVQVINMSLGFSSVDCGAQISPTLTPGGVYIDGGSASLDNVGPNAALCQSLRLAHVRDVLVVGAAGNNKNGWLTVLDPQGYNQSNPNVSLSLQFPARDYRTLAVGGVQLSATANAYPNIWDNQISLPQSPRVLPVGNDLKELGSNQGFNLGVVAPARNIVSTFYPNPIPNANVIGTFDWNPYFQCGSSVSMEGAVSMPGLPAAVNPGRYYGTCTGTSMPAPFVSGIAGIVRSMKPLTLHYSYQPSDISIRSVFANTARITNSSGVGWRAAGTYDTLWGFGLPQGDLIKTALLNINYVGYADPNFNRITPMLMMSAPIPGYNGIGDGAMDNFYSTVPSMAAAARDGNIFWPRGLTQEYCRAPETSLIAYTNILGRPDLPTGMSEPVCSVGFPCVGCPAPQPSDHLCGCRSYRNRPGKIFNVFTTPQDHYGNQLFAIYRYSFVNPADNTGRHVYITRLPSSTPPTLGSPLWKFDGIEGYVYPPGTAPYNTAIPTKKIFLMVKPATTTYAIVTEDQTTLYLNRGYQFDGNGSSHNFGGDFGQLGVVYQ